MQESFVASDCGPICDFEAMDRAVLPVQDLHHVAFLHNNRTLDLHLMAIWGDLAAAIENVAIAVTKQMQVADKNADRNCLCDSMGPLSPYQWRDDSNAPSGPLAWQPLSPQIEQVISQRRCEG